MELNREQIVKALECCLADRVICDNCPLQNECESNPFDATLARYALALIRELTDEVAKAKADTVRKMQERFNQVFGSMDATNALLRRTFDQIAKELLEEWT